MNRLTTTKKLDPEFFKNLKDIDENTYFLKIDGKSYEDAMGTIADKLGKLEDIEQELGIDLITLFKALKDGIYCKTGNKIEHILAPHLSWYCQQIYICNINDYGKTWALTKEELENESMEM